MTPTHRRKGVPGRIGGIALGAFLWLLAGTAGGVDFREAELFDALDRFDSGDRAGGLEELSRVVSNHPRFRAARLIHASLRETKDPRATLAALVPRRPASLLDEPTDEAHSRLSYWFRRPPRGHLPDVLVQAAPYRTKAVVADAARSRLYLFDWSDGGWTMRGDWYASIGRGGTAKRREGDLKTPLGVYFVTMWVADEYLSEYYGAGALGLNYPNGWDRHRRRDGYGIWIHGEPRGIQSRPPRWSQGCLMVSNAALEALVGAIGDHSIPVVIGERLRWLAPGEHASHRAAWRDRLASLNGRDGAVRGLGIYGYPVRAGDEPTMFLVEFRAGGDGGRRWRQYWRESADGVWRIAHEGPASFSEIHFEGLPRRMPPSGVHRYAP